MERLCIILGYIVGRFVGPEELGAVGSVGMVMFLFFSLCMGLSAGVGIIVSQYFGAEDYEKVQKTIDIKIVKDIFVLGLPVAGQNVMISLSTTLLQSVVNSYGSVVMAASTFSGQNVGAARYDGVKEGNRKAMKVMLAFSVVMIAIMMQVRQLDCGRFG